MREPAAIASSATREGDGEKKAAPTYLCRGREGRYRVLI
jgi:hypothetical protein